MRLGGGGCVITDHRAERGKPRRIGKLWWWICFAVLVLYVGWMIGPYLRSVLVRDAAVTTWVHVASAPIYGRVDQKLPELGHRIGADGILLRVHNERADRSRLEEATAEVARTEATAAELEARVASLQQLDDERQGLIRSYAEALTRSLAIDVNGATSELAFINRRLSLIKATAERKDALARKGSTARSEADEAAAEVAELELQRVEREKAIAQARLRQEEATIGVFLAEDGTDPDWAYRSRDPVQLELARTRGMQVDARANLAKARATVVAERAELERATDGIVSAPPGSVIWSMTVGAAASVDIGTPVAHWLDCSVVLVDVPVADVELALLHEGMAAEVVIEGEAATRRGEVVLTRGAAATLGSTDLAAVAKGRGPGVGQVILRLDRLPGNAGPCLVGRAAFVEFPEIGVLDVVRSRLRL